MERKVKMEILIKGKWTTLSFRWSKKVRMRTDSTIPAQIPVVKWKN
jgi:hypothetical protein